MIDKRILELHARLCTVFTSSKRLEILSLLREGELSVNELARRADIRQSNLSQHLALLRERGMVTTRRAGVTIYYALAHPRLMEAFDIVTEVLLERLDQDEQFSKAVKDVARDA